MITTPEQVHWLELLKIILNQLFKYVQRGEGNHKKEQKEIMRTVSHYIENINKDIEIMK